MKSFGGELFEGSKQFCFKSYVMRPQFESLLFIYDFFEIGIILLLSWMMRTLQSIILYSSITK
jgi:hypothetical protein